MTMIITVDVERAAKRLDKQLSMRAGDQLSPEARDLAAQVGVQILDPEGRPLIPAAGQAPPPVAVTTSGGSAQIEPLDIGIATAPIRVYAVPAAVPTDGGPAQIEPLDIGIATAPIQVYAVPAAVERAPEPQPVAPEPATLIVETSELAAGVPAPRTPAPRTAPAWVRRRRQRAMQRPAARAGIILGRIVGSAEVQAAVDSRLRVVRIAEDAYVTRAARHLADLARLQLVHDPELDWLPGQEGMVVNPLESGGALTRRGPGIVRSNGIPIGGDHDPGTLGQ